MRMGMFPCDPPWLIWKEGVPLLLGASSEKSSRARARGFWISGEGEENWRKLCRVTGNY